MQANSGEPELTYMNTGLMAGLLLATGSAELVVGGCGTGMGFLLSANQYPGVFSGLIINPLEAWLFSQINGGNCISLPLLYGYGWAGDVQLSFIFDRYFSVESGCGYPNHRKESQKRSRKLLQSINTLTHVSWEHIVEEMNDEVLSPVLLFPGFLERLEEEASYNAQLIEKLKQRR
jgi:ribose 5-phosphate isomerase RpiB